MRCWFLYIAHKIYCVWFDCKVCIEFSIGLAIFFHSSYSNITPPIKKLRISRFLESLEILTDFSLNFRGVIWGGLGGTVAPKEKEKKEKKEEKENREKKQKKERKKKGTMNNVKFLLIKCCFLQFLNSSVALKKKIGPLRKSWNDAPAQFPHSKMNPFRCSWK